MEIQYAVKCAARYRLSITIGAVVMAALTLTACESDVAPSSMGSSEMQAVQARYEQAESVIYDAMRTNQARVSEGYASTLPGDSSSWVALLDTSGTLSPGGDPAYKAGALSAADQASGVIGLMAANRGRSVTLTRPAYEDFSSQAARTVEYDL